MKNTNNKDPFEITNKKKAREFIRRLVNNENEREKSCYETAQQLANTVNTFAFSSNAIKFYKMSAQQNKNYRN